METIRKRKVQKISVRKILCELTEIKSLISLKFCDNLSINFSQLYLFRVEKYRETHWLSDHLNFGHVPSMRYLKREC